MSTRPGLSDMLYVTPRVGGDNYYTTTGVARQFRHQPMAVEWWRPVITVVTRSYTIHNHRNTFCAPAPAAAPSQIYAP